MKIKGIIFDLDQTLVDTQSVLKFREDKNWAKAIRNLYLTKVFPGVNEMLHKLSDIDIKCGVVTSSPRKYAEAAVSYHNLEIPVLVAYQDTGRHKPFPDPIIKGVVCLGLQAENVISVGDVDLDIIAGKNAGTMTAICGWSKQENECRIVPDIILNVPSDLINNKLNDLYSIQTGVKI